MRNATSQSSLKQSGRRGDCVALHNCKHTLLFHSTRLNAGSPSSAGDASPDDQTRQRATTVDDSSCLCRLIAKMCDKGVMFRALVAQIVAVKASAFSSEQSRPCFSFGEMSALCSLIVRAESGCRCVFLPHSAEIGGPPNNFGTIVPPVASAAGYSLIRKSTAKGPTNTHTL